MQSKLNKKTKKLFLEIIFSNKNANALISGTYDLFLGYFMEHGVESIWFFAHPELYIKGLSVFIMHLFLN